MDPGPDPKKRLRIHNTDSKNNITLSVRSRICIKMPRIWNTGDKERYGLGGKSLACVSLLAQHDLVTVTVHQCFFLISLKRPPVS